jgi:1-acyl-sn-glycerol-3-phosphate acyltransferase
MISRLIYRCPRCGGYDWLQADGCIHCGAAVRREQRRWLVVNGQRESIAYWYDRVRAMKLPSEADGSIYTSDRVQLYKEVARGRYAGPGGLSAELYGREFVDTVTATLYQDRIELAGNRHHRVILFATLLSITIESNVIIVVDRILGSLFLDFHNDSGKKWEDGIRRALLDYRKSERIVEFFPRILHPGNPRERRPHSIGRKLPRVKAGKAVPDGSHPVYSMARLVVRTVVEKGLQIELSGREHLPREGAAILLSNHSSFLDAIILEALTPRNIWFMAKNSQYKGRFMTWFLGLAKSFPVRRYTVDVQAVRNAIRVVQGGHILGIFPEGERSWDDRFLPFKRGTMRLVLALGVPVIPVGVSGAYGLMPRWTHRVKRVPVHIRCGAPLHIEPVSISAQTEEDIAAVTEKIRGAIQALVRQG